MLRNFNLNYFHIILIGATGFGLSVLMDTFWPMLSGMLLSALLLFFNSPKDGYTFKEEVTTTFSEQGYEIIKERRLNFLERMNRDPEVEINVFSINDIPINKKRYLRKYHRVFTVRTKDHEILDVLTEIKQHLDKTITVEILGTKVIENV